MKDCSGEGGVDGDDKSSGGVDDGRTSVCDGGGGEAGRK